MQADVQEQRGGASVTIVTCMNKACGLWSVTLTTDVYASLNETQLQEYRDMVAKLKQRFGY